jgi:hypothetical protein
VSKIYKFHVRKRKPFIHTYAIYDAIMYTGEKEGRREKGQPV